MISFKYQRCTFLVILMLLLSTHVNSQDLASNYLLVLKTYNQKGTPEKAIDFYKSHTFPGDDQNVQLELGKAYYNLKEYKQAANILVEINSKNPTLANYELAECYAVLGKPALSVKYLRAHLESRDRLMQRTIKSNHAFDTVAKSKEWINLWQTEWYNKYDLMLEDAWYLYEHGKYEDALEEVDHLNEIRVSLVKAFQLKALLYLALGETENALISINTAIEKRDQYPEFYATKARIEIELGKPRKALKSIGTAIKMDSTQLDFYFLEAKAYLHNKEIDKAGKVLKSLMALVPDFDIYKLAGEIYSEAEEYQEALKVFNKCIIIDKYDPEIYILRGKVFQNTGDWEFAERDYTMALDFKPFDGELYYLRGITRKMQHKADQACQDFQKAFTHKYMKADDEIRSYCQGR